MKNSHWFVFLLVAIAFCCPIYGQSITGEVTNDKGEAIPFVNIYVKQLLSGTASDENGVYFLKLDPGSYDFVYSAIGFESRTVLVEVTNEDVKNIVLKESDIELDEIVIRASKKDPAYAIIQKVVENKDKYRTQVETMRSKVYLKAFENIDQKEKEKESKFKRKEVDAADIDIDPFEEAEKLKEKEMGKYNLLEMQVQLNYMSPGKYKEERTAYKLYGSKEGLFVPTLGECDFNFYQNMVSVKGIADTPIISPLSRTAILSYKYKLIESKLEDGILVHKILINPRKQGNNTVSGYLFINEGAWSINRLELSLNKNAAKIFDKFEIVQNYDQTDEGLTLVHFQQFNYETKTGKAKTYHGSTTMRYSEFENNYPFEEKFFNNELSSLTQEAMDKDSSFWNDYRPVQLTEVQEKFVEYKDSVSTVLNSKEYKDSVQREFNKVDFLELAWEGLGFRNHERKEQIFIAPIPGFIGFQVVGGWRVGPYTSYFRKFKSGRFFSNQNYVSYGLLNKDLQGETWNQFRYNPHKLSDLIFSVGRRFKAFYPDDAFLNLLQPSNYFLSDQLDIGHSTELINGLYLTTLAGQQWRQSIKNYDAGAFFERIIEEGEIREFKDYEAFLTLVELKYTPGQKYITEPTRKVVLGSKWPTFSVSHRKGWKGVFSSDIDFDYLEFRIEQDIVLGMFGNSKYAAFSGRFLNKKDLRFIDTKRFRQSDIRWYSDPLSTFQELDTTLVTESPFYEVHWIHHFNGALINNIPLMRKTRISVVTGGGALWIPSDKFNHQELFAGIERIFKIGPRRRLRIGLYGTLGTNNLSETNTGFKFSLDIIDTWQRDWSF